MKNEDKKTKKKKKEDVRIGLPKYLTPSARNIGSYFFTCIKKASNV